MLPIQGDLRAQRVEMIMVALDAFLQPRRMFFEQRLALTEDNDERRRLLALTPKGKKLVKKLQPTWNNIATVANQLLDSADYDLLKLIDQIESELDNKEFHKRYYSFTGG